MIPISIEMTVSSSVIRTPCRIRESNRYWPTTCHSKRELLTIERTIEAATSSTTTEAIQRPGWRTGTALMSSGRPARSSEESSEVLTSEP